MRKKIKKIISASGMAIAMITVMYVGALKIAFRKCKEAKNHERD